MTLKSVTSRDNPLYKELKLLATSSPARRKAGRTLLDGVHLCQAYLQRFGLPPLYVVSETARHHAEVAEILQQCEHPGAQGVILPDALYHALSQVEHGIDLLFVIDTPQPIVPDSVTCGAVLLDALQDPGNLGSILRSAAAAGISQVFCGPGTTFSWSPKVLRAGMGAHFQLQIYEGVDLQALLHKTRIPVIATSSHATQSIYALELSQPVGWLFGHEGQGVAPALLQYATHQAAIPHRGEVESLNVAASAAVCFFEQLRQQLKA